VRAVFIILYDGVGRDVKVNKNRDKITFESYKFILMKYNQQVHSKKNISTTAVAYKNALSSSNNCGYTMYLLALTGASTYSVAYKALTA
jgi:hypothetical protein